MSFALASFIRFRLNFILFFFLLSLFFIEKLVETLTLLAPDSLFLSSCLFSTQMCRDTSQCLSYFQFEISRNFFVRFDFVWFVFFLMIRDGSPSPINWFQFVCRRPFSCRLNINCVLCICNCVWMLWPLFVWVLKSVMSALQDRYVDDFPTLSSLVHDHSFIMLTTWSMSLNFFEIISFSMQTSGDRSAVILYDKNTIKILQLVV